MGLWFSSGPESANQEISPCIFYMLRAKLYLGDNMAKKLLGQSLILIIGGFGYGMIEIIWRKYTHWTMIITGGVCFSCLYNIFCKFQQIKMWKKCVLGGWIITGTEFCAGFIINICFKMNVWDYSSQPLNLMGQICPLYSFLWSCLSCPVAILCKKLSKTKLLSIKETSVTS